MPDPLTPARHAALRGRLPDLLRPRGLDAGGRELVAHLEDCPPCRQRLERLRRVHALLGEAGPAPEPSSELVDRIRAIPLHTQDARPPRPGRRARVAVLGAAAAVVVAIALVVLPGGDEGPTFAPATTLDASDSSIAVAVAMGAYEGDLMPMRITASGLTPGERYSLWLAGERGEVLVETFRPDKVGDCRVVVSAPVGAWTRALVRADDGPGDPVIAWSTI